MMNKCAKLHVAILAITVFKTASREGNKIFGDGLFSVQLFIENRASNFGGTFDRFSFEFV